MNKYLFFIIIGIILFILYNSVDNFSVGIPWRIELKDYGAGVGFGTMYGYFDTRQDAMDELTRDLSEDEDEQMYISGQQPVKVDELHNPITPGTEQQVCETNPDEIERSCQPEPEPEPENVCGASSLQGPCLGVPRLFTTQGFRDTNTNSDDCKDFHSRLPCLSLEQANRLFVEYIRISVLFISQLSPSQREQRVREQREHNLAFTKLLLNQGNVLPYQLFETINRLSCQVMELHQYNSFIATIESIIPFLIDLPELLEQYTNDRKSDFVFILLLTIDLGLNQIIDNDEGDRVFERYGLEHMKFFEYIMESITSQSSYREVNINDYTARTYTDSRSVIIQVLTRYYNSNNNNRYRILQVLFDRGIIINNVEDFKNMDTSELINIFRDLLENLRIVNRELYIRYFITDEL
jgi:hypothetical protein